MNRRIQVVFFALGLAFFAWLITHTGPRRILADLARTSWMFVPILLVWGAVYVCNTGAWLLIVEARDETGTTRIPFARAFAITVSSFALNYVTPMVSLGGEPFKVATSARWLGTRRAASSVVAFRVVHTVGQFIFWLISLPFAYALLPHDRWSLSVFVAVGATLIVAAALLALLLQARALERLLNTIQRTPLLRRFSGALERRRTAFAEVDAQLRALVHERPARVLGALAIEVFSRFVAALEFFLIARSIGVEMGYVAAVVVGAFSQLVMNMLFFVPFELGAREGGLYLAITLLGFNADLGVYTAIVTRLRELAWICVGLTLIWTTGSTRRGARAASDTPATAGAASENR